MSLSRALGDWFSGGECEEGVEEAADAAAATPSRAAERRRHLLILISLLFRRGVGREPPRERSELPRCGFPRRAGGEGRGARNKVMFLR